MFNSQSPTKHSANVVQNKPGKNELRGARKKEIDMQKMAAQEKDKNVGVFNE
jgi:hypothetical protein